MKLTPEQEAEQAARDLFPGLDWSYPENLGATAVQRGFYRKGFAAGLAARERETAIHYPECWDTTAYPTVEDALGELYAWFKCRECVEPAPINSPADLLVCKQCGADRAKEDCKWADRLNCDLKGMAQSTAEPSANTEGADAFTAAWAEHQYHCTVYSFTKGWNSCRQHFTEGAAQSQEPVAVAYRVIGEGGMPMTDWIDGDTSDPPAFPNGWIQRAYAAPNPPAAQKDSEDRT